MKYRISILALFFCAFCGCMSKQAEPVAKCQIELFMDGYEKPVSLVMSSIIDSVTTVCLDFPDSVVPAHIVCLKCISNRFYLFDEKQNSILIFDKSGRFVSSFSKAGHAKNEYIKIQNFDVNPSSGEISIYDSATRKMKIYDSDGNFITESIMEDVIRDFAVLPSGDYLFYTPDKMKGNKRGLWKTDSSCKFKEQLVDIPDDYLMEGVYPSYFSRVNDTTIGIMCGEYCDRIYHISDHGYEVACQIIVDRKIPKRLRKQENLDFGLYKDKLYTKNCYVEISDLLMFCVTDTEKYIWIICNKVSGEIWQGQPSDIIDDINFNFSTNTTDFIVGYTITPDGDIKLPIFTTTKK